MILDGRQFQSLSQPSWILDANGQSLLATNVAAMQISLFGEETQITHQFPEVREKVRRALHPDQTIHSLELTLDNLPGKISLSRIQWDERAAWLVCYLDNHTQNAKPLDWIIESAEQDIQFPIKSSNGKFRALFYQHPEMALLLNRHGHILDINRQGVMIMGLSKSKLLGKPYKTCLHEEDRKTACQHFNYTMTTGAGTAYTTRTIMPDGTTTTHRVALIPAYENRIITGAFAISRDVTRYQKQNTNPMLDRTLFEKAAEAAGDVIWDYNLETQEIWWSPGLERHFGYHLDSPVTSIIFWLGRIHPDDLGGVLDSYKRFRRSGEDHWEIRYRFVKSNGSYAHVLERALLVKDDYGQPARLVGAIINETELHHKQMQLKKSLKEKEHLIAEVHHRVKNNMALITSILELQTDFVDNKQLHRIIENSQSRIKSIAMVHEQLYRSESFSRIAVGEHIRQIVQMHRQSFENKGQHFEVKMDIEDLYLNINQAIPLSLLVGELISNAMAHAYPNQNKGTIYITLREIGGRLHITIEDEGVGMEENPLDADSLGMGYTLISTLLMQLEAEYEIDSNSGLRFYFNFPVINQLKGSGSSMNLDG